VKKSTILFLLFVSFTICHAQESTTKFGVIYKPIFPSTYFRTGPKEFSDNNVKFKIAQSSGFSAGASIRKGLTKSLSIEAALCYVKRRYNLQITDTTFTGNSSYKIIGYEIPVQALVFVQLSQEIWMNVALGPSIDIFPSDIRTEGNYFVQHSTRNSKLQVFNTGILANIGWEWRTKKSGYFYLGSSYHRSLNEPYTSYIGYRRTVNQSAADAFGKVNHSGDYLTFDLRYYFYEQQKGNVQKD
jgi:hypothetical protein